MIPITPTIFRVYTSIDTSPMMSSSSSRRFNTKSLDWFLFSKGVEEIILGLLDDLNGGANPSRVYDNFMDSDFKILEDCGAFRFGSHRVRRKVQ